MIIPINFVISAWWIIRTVIIKSSNHVKFIAFKIFIIDIISKLEFGFKFLHWFMFGFLFIINWTKWDDLTIKKGLINPSIEIICIKYLVDVLIVLSLISSLNIIDPTIDFHFRKTKKQMRYTKIKDRIYAHSNIHLSPLEYWDN
jgi:hypothetical protein